MGKVYILSPFENKMAKRGTRHPMLAEMLVKYGHEVEYVTTNYSHARKEYFDQKEIRYYQKTVPYKLTLINVPSYKNNISVKRTFVHLVLSFKFYKYLLRIVKNNDVLILPSRPPELIFAASRIKRKTGCKLVLDIRDIWPDSLKTESVIKNKSFEIYCNFFQRLALPEIDRAVHVAPSFQNWLNRYVPDMRSVFIPLGFDEDRWKRLEDIKKENLKETIHVVYVGHLQHVISLDDVMGALKNLDGYYLTIIGEGENFEYLKGLALDLQMRNIRFTGYISYEEVVEELMSKDIGVMPMKASSMPNKIYDYIASSLPILVLGENDASQFVIQHGFGWKLPFDIEKIRLFFETLPRDEVIEKIQNIKKARRLYSKELIYKKYVEVVEN